jgi:hypothetical protein
MTPHQPEAYRMHGTRAAIAVVIATALSAQNGPAQDAGVPKTEPGLAAQRTLVSQYDAAMRAFQTALTAVTESAEFKRAQEAGDRDAQNALRARVKAVDTEAFAQRALKEAEQFHGDDATPLYCQAVLWGGGRPAAKTALEVLQREHLASSHLGVLLGDGFPSANRSMTAEESATLLERVIDENKFEPVRAAAMYWRAGQLKGKNASAADKERAARLLADAEHIAAGTLLGDRIAAPKFERERLQIGMTAPEIEGVDTDGTRFKLSDYRGKVVVIDFWGFW